MKKKKLGFTLSETLITVAIILILGALAGVMVFRYQRKLKQLEYDSAAKEIFLAAQNHLSTAYSQGYLAKSEWGQEEGQGVYYYFVGGAPEDGYGERESQASLLGTILPQSALDETTLSQGSYLLRYFKTTGTVLDVFYTNKDDDRFGCTLLPDDYDELMTNWADTASADRKAERLHYHNKNTENAVIGYYGGANSVPAWVNYGKAIEAPSLEIINGDDLELRITDPNFTNAKASLTLTMQGLQSGRTLNLVLTKDGGVVEPAQGNLLTKGVDGEGNGSLTIILDSVVDGARHFKSMYCQGAEPFIAGEDLSFYLTSTSSERSNTATSATLVTNSLFAEADFANGQVTVNNFRHLENLDSTVSGFDQTVSAYTVRSAALDTDLDWNTWIDNHKDAAITGWNGSSLTEKEHFYPVTTVGALNFSAMSGNNSGYSISHIKVHTSGTLPAGLFGTLKDGSSVRLLNILDPSIRSESGEAGGLAGSVSSTELTGVLVRNTTSVSNIGIQGFYAGGLAGSITGSTVNSCAAAVYVLSENREENSSVQTGAAGGLIGCMSGVCAVSNSYSGGHTYLARYQDVNGDSQGHNNVISAGHAGGFVGNTALADGSSIHNCYTTCSAYSSNGSAYAGGFVGVSGAVTIEHSYCTGRVSGLAQNGYFAGVINNTTFSGSNYYLSNMSILSNADKSRDSAFIATNDSYAAQVIGVNGGSAAGTDKKTHNDFIIPEENRMDAVVYDTSLIVEYEDKYYFPTIDMLAGSTLGYNFTAVHYGDWQVPSLDSLQFSLANADKLFMTIDIPDGESGKDLKTIAFSILGETSNVARMFKFTVNDDGSIRLSGRGYAVNGAAVWNKLVDLESAEETDSAVLDTTLAPEYVEDEEGRVKQIIITLDDITKEGQHFYQLFCADAKDGENSTNLYPGENIIINVSSSIKNANFSWAELAEGEYPLIDNSLFAQDGSGLTAGTASLKYLRHLQNLDSEVSGLVSQPGAMITKAKLLQTISGEDADRKSVFDEGGVYAAIYNKDSSKHAQGTFLGIANSSLEEFDGNYCVLDKLTLNGAVSEAVETAGTSLGLFRTVRSNLAVKNLKLKDWSVNGGQAGGYLAGKVEKMTSAVTLTTENVLALSKDKVLTISGTEGAGGLIGAVANGAVVKLNNTAASVMVSSNGHSGGLIGRVSASEVHLKNSYVGGHVNEAGKYSMASANSMNVYGVQSAGGWIGLLEQSALTAEDSFGAASVGAADGGYAGGIIGKAEGGSIDFGTVYFVAPVYGVTGTHTNNNSGALQGVFSGVSIEADSIYYLPEIYHGTGEVRIGGTGNAAGQLLTAQSAFYEKDNDKVVVAATYRENESDKFELISYRTYSFSSGLEGKEYPFVLWAEFTFPEDSINGEHCYYGDWEPVNPNASDMRSVNFTYVNPLDGKELPVPDSDKWTQKILLGQDNSVIAPFMNPVDGYEVSGWVLYDATKEITLSDKLYSLEDNGSILLTAAECSEQKIPNDVKFVAQYVATNDCAVRYYYKPDPSQTGSSYVLMQKQTVNKGISGNALIEAAPNRSIIGYQFEGWYTDEACTKKLNGNGIVNDPSLSLYAKYVNEDYYIVTLDFMYMVEGSTVSDIRAVPWYQIDSQSEFRWYIPKAQTDPQTVTLTLPDMGEGYRLYEGEDGIGIYGEVNGTISIAGQVLTMTSTDECHYYILYVAKEYQEVDTGSYNLYYVFNHTKNTGSTAKMSFDDTESNTVLISENVSFIMGGTPELHAPEFEGYNCTAKVTGAVGPQTNNFYIYYERNSAVLSYDLMGGYTDSSESADSRLIYEGQQTSTLPKPSVRKEGYNEGGLTWKLVLKSDKNSEYKETLVGTEDLVYVAIWPPKSVQYRVSFWYENADDTAYSYLGSYKPNTLVMSGSSTSTLVGTTAAWAKGLLDASGLKWADSKYFTFSHARCNDTEVQVDGSTTVNVYYSRNTYELRFDNVAAHTHTDACNHVHTDECYDHVHDESCKHVHTDECYHDHINECYHVHTADCYHVHTDDCYHEHDGSCYDHVHTDKCYHHHTDACKHVHSLSCYDVGSEVTYSTTRRLKTGSGCLSGSENMPIYKYGSREITFDNSKTTDLTIVDYYDVTGKKQGDTVPNSPSGKVICYQGKWYICNSEQRTCGLNAGALTCGKQENELVCTIIPQLICGHEVGDIVCGKNEETLVCGMTETTCICEYKNLPDHSLICGYKEGDNDCGKTMTPICGYKEGEKDCGYSESGNNYNKTYTYKKEVKYQASIYDIFIDVTGNRIGYWTEQNGHYDYILLTLDRMPGFNLNFKWGSRNSYTGTYIYYVEALQEDINAGRAKRVSVGSKNLYYVEFKTFKHAFEALTQIEDFHDINGFTQLALNYKSGTELKYDKTDGATHSFSSYGTGRGDAQLYYTRNSYQLVFNVAKDYSEHKQPVPYQTLLTGVASTETASLSCPAEYAGKGYTFSGWFLDETYTTPLKDTDRMPAGGMQLYGYWVAPEATINLWASKEAMESGAAPMKTITKRPDGKPIRVNETMEDNAGKSLLPVPEAIAEDKLFRNWYYQSGEDEKVFLSSSPIPGTTMNLYAVWGDRFTDTKMKEVVVSYLDMENLDDPTHLKDGLKWPAAKVLGEYEVGQSVTVDAEFIDGYYPIYMRQNYVVQDSPVNTITFYYKNVNSWSYDVEYYVRLTSDGTLPGVSGITAGGVNYDYLISRNAIPIPAKSQTETLSFDWPSGFDNYLYDGYEYIVKKGTKVNDPVRGKDAQISLSPEAGSHVTVRFYLIPNTNAVSVSSQYYKYDSKSHAKTDETLTNVFKMPDGMSASLQVKYVYSIGGKQVTADKVIDAGVYDVKAYQLLTVTGQSVSDTAPVERTFLLWTNEPGSLSLTMAKRNVVLVSASKTAKYNSADPEPVIAKSYTNEGDAFLEGDGVEVFFTVDAFRFSPGTTANAFSYVPLAGCEERLEKNYVIEVRFGTLKVTD